MSTGQLHPSESSQELQRRLYLCAKSSRNRRFHALYDRISRSDILLQAWREVSSNKGSAGVDKMTISEIKSIGVNKFLQEVKEELENHSYIPSPVKRVYIPKSDGSLRQRPLGIPTVKDRLIQQACKIIIEPIFEADFLDCSYGFRPGRNCHQAIIRTKWSLVYKWWVVDCDIQSFFDRLGQGKLMSLLQKRISDRRVLKLIRQWLEAGVMEDGFRMRTEMGTPQGGVVSPLLANIYLHELDKVWSQNDYLGVFVRYADDFVAICRTEKNAVKALKLIEDTVKSLELNLHPDKTRIVNMEKEGFDFLGFHFHKRENLKKNQILPYIWPSPKAMKSVRSKLHDITARNNLYKPVKEIVLKLNEVIRGWRNYFRIGNSTNKFRQLDRYVKMRLIKFARNKKGQKRYKFRLKTFLKWYFQCGLERFYFKWVCNQRILKRIGKKVVGKPYEGKPHVRFDAAGDGTR